MHFYKYSDKNHKRKRQHEGECCAKLKLLKRYNSKVICLTTYFFSSDKTVIVIDLLLMGTLIYAPLTLVGLMVNEVVPKFAVGSSTGFMGFF